MSRSISLAPSARPLRVGRTRDAAPRGMTHSSIEERNILAIVFTNWEYVGDGYRRRAGGEGGAGAIPCKITYRGTTISVRVMRGEWARMWARYGRLLHGAGTQMDPCG